MESRSEIFSGATKGPEHGRYSTYTNHGCRCDECKAASRAYWQARHKATYVPRERKPRWPEPLGVCAYCTAPTAPNDGHWPEYCSSRCAGSQQRLTRVRLCVTCGLPWRTKKIASSAVHCPECRPHREPGAPPADMSSGMRRTRRRQLAERDGDCCSCCGAVEALEVHHVIPRGEGGTHALANLKLLCKDCHDGVHGRCASPPLPLAA